MGEFIDPAIVPKMKVYTGEEIPGIGMGTFGEQSAVVTGCLTALHAMETKIRSERYLKMLSMKAS